jgi:hypothetical protein
LKGKMLANALSQAQLDMADLTAGRFAQMTPIEVETAQVNLAALQKRLRILDEESRYLPAAEREKLKLLRAQVKLAEHTAKSAPTRTASTLASEASQRSYQAGSLAVARTNAATGQDEVRLRGESLKQERADRATRLRGELAEAKTKEEKALTTHVLDLSGRVGKVLDYYRSDPELRVVDKKAAPSGASFTVLESLVKKLPEGPVQTELLTELEEAKALRDAERDAAQQ